MKGGSTDLCKALECAGTAGNGGAPGAPSPSIRQVPAKIRPHVPSVFPGRRRPPYSRSPSPLAQGTRSQPGAAQTLRLGWVALRSRCQLLLGVLIISKDKLCKVLLVQEASQFLKPCAS